MRTREPLSGGGASSSIADESRVPGAPLAAGAGWEFDAVLLKLSVALGDSAPGDDIAHWIAEWLDPFSLLIGADRCCVFEFRSVDELPRLDVAWRPGEAPGALSYDPDSCVREALLDHIPFLARSPEEIPEAATNVRKLFEDTGACGGIMAPVVDRGSVIGGLGFTWEREHDLTHELVQQSQIVAGLLGNALRMYRDAEAANDRLEFEQLLHAISTLLADKDLGLDETVGSSLRLLSDFLRIDRLAYLEIDAENQQVFSSNVWVTDHPSNDLLVAGLGESPPCPWMTHVMASGRTTVIEKLEELPADAEFERRFAESMGVTSFALVPVSLRDSLTAALILDKFGGVLSCDSHILRRLKVAVSMIASEVHSEGAERDVRQSQRFERMLSEISRRFVNLRPEEIDDHINMALALIGDTLGAELVTLSQPCGTDDFIITHQMQGGSGIDHDVRGKKLSEFGPWIAKQVARSKSHTIIINSIDDWPEEASAERAAAEQAGIQSAVGAHFEIQGNTGGAIAIDSRRPNAFPPMIIKQLQVLGEFFAETMRRRDAELALKQSFVEIKTLKDQLQQENVYLREEARRTRPLGDIIGDSSALQAALDKAAQVAATKATVLIEGETGTGKELLAAAIHEQSSRRDKLLVKVNCAALPSSLVEAELFGREKGAYTGALSRERGRFEIADGSTILLDEIGELPLELQGKLLRVLQDGEFERLGSSKTVKVNVRVLAATNKDLGRAVMNKEFRDDLYYRLNVFPIELPPLRDRVEDIPLLVWAFVQEFSEQTDKSFEKIPQESMEALQQHSWPGNIRELRNVVERAVILGTEPVLHIEPPESAAGEMPGQTRLDDVEREHIRRIVESTGWRVSGEGGAAELLGLKPTTLEARMKKLGLERPVRHQGSGS